MKKRLVYLDALRIAACIMVVFIHVNAAFLYKEPVNSLSYLFVSTFNGLGFAGVNLFVMISGALFLAKEKELDLMTLYRHNILRLLVVYYLWTLIFIISYHYKTGITSSDEFTDILRAFLCADGTYHLWYLPMTIGLYMLLPVVKPAFENSIKISRYYVILFFVVQIMLPFILMFKFSGRSVILDLSTSQPLIAITGYLGYFVLGHFLNTENFNKKERTTALLVTGALTVICIALAYTLSNIYKEPVTDLNTTFSLMTFSLSVFLFVLFKGVGFETAKEKTVKVITYISSLTLGIYLIHPLFLSVFSERFRLPAVPSVIVTGLLVLVLSAAVTMIIRLIPKVGKYIT